MNRSPLVLLVAAVGLLAACKDGIGPADGPPPTILSVEPATGTVGTDLPIMGSDFRSGASAAIGTLASQQVDVQASTEVFVTVPEGVVAGTTYDVMIKNSDGTDVTYSEAFTAVAPVLDFVNGATKPSGNAGSTIILEGQAFGDRQGPGRVGSLTVSEAR